MATEAGGMHPIGMLSCYFLHCPEYYISSPKILSEGKESYVETMYVLTSGFLVSRSTICLYLYLVASHENGYKLK